MCACILDSSLNGIFGKHRAVQLDGREAQVFRYFRVLDLDCLVHIHALCVRVQSSSSVQGYDADAPTAEKT